MAAVNPPMPSRASREVLQRLERAQQLANGMQQTKLSKGLGPAKVAKPK